MLWLFGSSGLHMYSEKLKDWLLYITFPQMNMKIFKNLVPTIDDVMDDKNTYICIY